MSSEATSTAPAIVVGGGDFEVEGLEHLLSPPQLTPNRRVRGASLSATPLSTEHLSASPSNILTQSSSLPSSPASSVAGDDEDGHRSDVSHDNEPRPDRGEVLAEVWAQLGLLVGLERVKDQCRDVEKKVEALKKLNLDPRKERFHIMFLGNPGTG